MDAVLNPFSPGAGSPPPELIGRSGVLEDARVLIGRLKVGRSVQSLLLNGLRGVGKTVILNEIRDMARTSLIRKGMIFSPAYGEISFTVPLFAEFLRRTTRI